MPKTDEGWTDSKKWIMGIVAAVIVAGAGALLFDPVGTFFSKKLEQSEPTTVQITASLKTFDIISEKIGSPQIVDVQPGPPDEIEEIVRENLWPRMRAIMVPRDLPETITVKLHISNAKIYTDQPLVAFFDRRYTTPAQFSLPQRELLEDAPVDLSEAFRLTENPSGESENDLRIQLEHKSGRYRRAHITVSGAQDFVFKPASDGPVNVVLKRIDERTRVLIADPKVKGLRSPLTDSVLVRFTNALNQALQESDAVELVGFTLEELQEKREELKKTLEWSAGKVDVLEDLDVDFIVDTTLLFQ